MTWKDGGKVGIGTDSPGALLEVSVAQSEVMRLATTSSTGAGWLTTEQAGTPRMYIGHQTSTGGGVVTAGIASAGVVRGETGLHLVTGSQATKGLTVDTNGNVGISTTDPDHALHVLGVSRVVEIEPTVSTASAYLTVNNTEATLNIGVEGASGGGIVAGSSAYGSVIGAANSGRDLHLATTGTVRMTLDNNGKTTFDNSQEAFSQSDASVLVSGGLGVAKRLIAERVASGGGIIDFDAVSGSNFMQLNSGVLTAYVSGTAGFSQKGGNVGIGRTDPIVPLDVVGSSRISKNSSTDGANYITLTNTESTGKIWHIGNDNMVQGGQFYIADGSVARISVDGTGNVGIGDHTPDAKLDVAGTIKAEEVVLESSGADFVFEADYPLRPLPEVESHIQVHKHLPEIPSAAQMQAEGVSMSQMQTKLLQKVEELTLYAIAQDKRLKTQQAENTALKAQVTALVERMEKIEKR